jgi:superoxide reductase
MQRRRFFSLAGAGALVGLPAAAAAQVVREGWSGAGEPTGREPSDAAALSDEERVHVPVLSLPARVRAGRAFDLVVQIGVRPHESTAEHRIDWIEVALGPAAGASGEWRRVVVADLSVDVPYPVLRVPVMIREPATLVARARCNVHGVWRTVRELTPT